jgi:hypothetical protein
MSRYKLNPGEAWAETYRLLDERKAGIATATWRIVDASFFPDDPGLMAAERDVLQPWTANRKASVTRTFRERMSNVWLIPLQTPLDGELFVNATVPPGGLHEVALLAHDRSTVLRRAQWVGKRKRRVTAAVCGQRELFVRVTRKGALGKVTVTTSTP